VPGRNELTISDTSCVVAVLRYMELA
jgi:hypothetical protein